MAYEDSVLEPPKPTLTGGSAVQTATDPNGDKWQFDNEGGNWVNLKSGETVSPKVFSQLAGRSGNAANDTMALAQAMKQEENSLAPQRPAPVSAPSMPQAPIAPPQPAASPPQSMVMPPAQIASPETIARVQAQRPVPSTVIPPPQEAVDNYQMQSMLRRGVPMKDTVAAMDASRRYQAQRGYQADIPTLGEAGALAKWGPMLFSGSRGTMPSASKRYNVAGVGLVDETGKVITPHPDSPQTRIVQGVGLVDAATGKVIVPSVQKPETQTVTEHIPAQAGVAGTPAQPASKGYFLGIGAHPAIPAVPETPTIPAHTISRRVPVQPPSTSATSKSTGRRVKVTGPNGRKGTIEEGDTLPEGWKLAE